MIGVVQSAPTPLGFTAADLIAIIAVIVAIFVPLLTCIAVLVLRTLNSMDARITEVRDDATGAVKDLRRDLSSDLSTLWAAIRAPASAGVAGPPRAVEEG